MWGLVGMVVILQPSNITLLVVWIIFIAL